MNMKDPDMPIPIKKKQIKANKMVWTKNNGKSVKIKMLMERMKPLFNIPVLRTNHLQKNMKPAAEIKEVPNNKPRRKD